VASAASDYPTSVATFGSGQAGFFWSGDWDVPTFQATKLPFDVTTAPNVLGGEQTWADSHSFVIPQGAKHVDRAIDFIRFALRNSVTWAAGGHVPAYTPVRDSKAYHKLVPESHYAAEAKHVAYDPPLWFSGAASDLETQAGAAFMAVMAGSSSPQQGLDQFTSAMEPFASAPTPF
jgi:multiple sugar transport system substrate-binding protein